MALTVEALESFSGFSEDDTFCFTDIIETYLTKYSFRGIADMYVIK